MKKGNSVRSAWLCAAVAAIVSGGPVASSLAAEVYTWVDEAGVVHFSDRKPAHGDVSTIEIGGAYRPDTGDTDENATRSQTGEPDDGAEEDGEPAPNAAEQIRRRMAADRQKRQAEDARKEFWCNRHRSRLEQMEPARRVYYIDEAGEEVRMDDDQRIGLIEESKTFLAKNCQ